MNLLIFNNTKEHRFEFTVSDVNAHIDYSLGVETIVFHHSRLPEDLRELFISHVVDYARENHLKIIATCPEIRKYIRSHAEEFVCVGKIFVAVI